MSAFTKTLIVDASHQEVVGQYYQTIKKATQYFIDREIGGTIIVEQGEYLFNEQDITGNWNTTVYVPSNVTIIGTGNVVIRITTVNNISVFKNASPSEGNTNIKIEGFKIIYDGPENEMLTMHPVFLTNCSKCRLKNLTITTNNKPVFIDADNIVSAIYFYSPEMVTIEGCRIHDFGAINSDKYFYGGGIELYESSRCIIKNNIISQVGFTPILEIGSNMLNISSNIVFDIKVVVSGIQMGTTNSVVKGNIVNKAGNEIVTSHGYYSSGGKNAAVFGNIFNGNSKSGVHLRYADITKLDTLYYALTGNIFMENIQCGIHAQSGTGRSTFFGNQLNENTASGIRIQREYEEPPHETTPKGVAPIDHCIVGNIGNNNDMSSTHVDISVTEPGKQIVANNIGSFKEG